VTRLKDKRKAKVARLKAKVTRLKDKRKD